MEYDCVGKFFDIIVDWEVCFIISKFVICKFEVYLKFYLKIYDRRDFFGEFICKIIVFLWFVI